MSKIVKCKTCNEEMAANAKACPKCGAKNKKPFYKKWWFWAIIGIVVIAIGTSGNDSGNSNSEQNTETKQETSQAETIEYTAYTVSELVNDLEENALKAEEKYKNKYVEITGRLSVIDSDGRYISLNPTENEFCLTGVQCYIKNDEQKSKVLELSKGDVLKVKGKIKSIGEVMGYSLDIDSIN